jgi:hypothetical protein
MRRQVLPLVTKNITNVFRDMTPSVSYIFVDVSEGLEAT